MVVMHLSTASVGESPLAVLANPSAKSWMSEVLRFLIWMIRPFFS